MLGGNHLRMIGGVAVAQAGELVTRGGELLAQQFGVIAHAEFALQRLDFTLEPHHVGV